MAMLDGRGINNADLDFSSRAAAGMLEFFHLRRQITRGRGSRSDNGDVGSGSDVSLQINVDADRRFRRRNIGSRKAKVISGDGIKISLSIDNFSIRIRMRQSGVISEVELHATISDRIESFYPVFQIELCNRFV